MAQQTSSTRVLAPQVAPRILKVSKQRKRRASEDEEPEAFVHNLREHMTTGGTANKRYEGKETCI